VQPLSLLLGGATSTHEIFWRQGSIEFATWAGTESQAAPLASWSHAGSVPQPDFERVHFNLWLVDGKPPAAPVEVVIRSFESDVPSDVRGASAVPEVARLGVPSPARGSLRYTLDLSRRAPVALRLFDPRGRMVRQVARGTLPAGVHQGLWNASGLAQGLYFLRLDTGGSTTTARVVLLR
jgi:hypothetical protein